MPEHQEATNKELIRRTVKAFNERDRQTFDACYADELVVWIGEGPDDYFTIDHDKHWQVVEDLSARLDIEAAEREVLAEGNRVFVRWTYSITHLGELQGVAGTGQTVDYAAWQVFTVRNGVIAEERTLMDRAHLYNALGIIDLPSG